MTHSSYVHGTHSEEQKRLSLLNDILNTAALRELGLTGGERILDVGSGLGQLARAMARQTGHPVVGVERSAEQIAEARRQAEEAGEAHLVDLRQGDVLAGLPLTPAEWGSFDVAHTRFLLEHVPDPLPVVRAMVRAVRPGGRVVLADDDHAVLRLWPEPAGFAALWEAYVETYVRAGNDPWIGRRLVALLHEAGASPRHNTWLFFGSCAGAVTFPTLHANLLGVIVGARDATLATGRIDAPAWEAACAALRMWGERPDAAIWYSVAWAEGVVGIG